MTIVVYEINRKVRESAPAYLISFSLMKVVKMVP